MAHPKCHILRIYPMIYAGNSPLIFTITLSQQSSYGFPLVFPLLYFPMY